jgi:hypothetical protein
MCALNSVSILRFNSKPFSLLKTTSKENMKTHQVEFVRAAYAFNGNSAVISRKKIMELMDSRPDLTRPRWLTGNRKYRSAIRGHYNLPAECIGVSTGVSSPNATPANTRATSTKAGRPPVKVVKVAAPAPAEDSDSSPAAVVSAVSESLVHDVSMDFNGGQSLVPSRMDVYVPWGNHDFVRKIVDSGAFFPVYISGLSGNGKTTTIEQVCAETGREFFRVNITTETDEDDLLGGFRLIDGNTVFQYGPVVEAMRRGGILVLDEVDQGSTKVMCLQSVLEGRGVYLKKINRWIHPAAGFNVFLTGNTKGQGNGEHDDKFVGAQVMNEAFLDRIPVMIEQNYPPVTVEKKILVKVVTKFCGSADDDAKSFIENLAKWAEIVRRTFEEGAIEDVITTRRLVQIIQAYCILGDRLESIRNCVTRFDRSVQESFLSLYTKIDAEVSASAAELPLPGAAAAETPVGSNWNVIVKCNFGDRHEVKAAGGIWYPDHRSWVISRSGWDRLAVDTRKTFIKTFECKWFEMNDNGTTSGVIHKIHRALRESDILENVAAVA